RVDQIVRQQGISPQDAEYSVAQETTQPQPPAAAAAGRPAEPPPAVEPPAAVRPAEAAAPQPPAGRGPEILPGERPAPTLTELPQAARAPVQQAIEQAAHMPSPTDALEHLHQALIQHEAFAPAPVAQAEQALAQRRQELAAPAFTPLEVEQ